MDQGHEHGRLFLVHQEPVVSSARGRLLRNLPPTLEHAAQAIEALVYVWSFHHQRLELSQVIRHSDKLSNLVDKRLEFAEHGDVFAVRVHKHFLVYPAVVHKRRGHVPERSNHSVEGACIVSAAEYFYDVPRALRIEI